MKKNVLSALFLIFVGVQAHGLSELEVSGEMDATGSVWNLPTGVRGESSFNIPTLFLDMNAPLKDDNLLVLRFEGSEEKDTSAERFDVKVREAYLDLVSVFQGMKALRVGLIPQVWQEARYESWDYRFLGRNAWDMTEKWRYQAPSDLGLSYMSQLPYDLGEAAFTLSNGEGGREKEAGPQKEAALFLRFVVLNPWNFSVNYARGSYDRYGENVAVKERFQGLMTYSQEKWQAGIEYLGTRDPADAVRDYKMAEGVDVTALSGQSVAGQAFSVFTNFSTGPKAEVMVRYDYLNAVVGESGKDLQTGIVALSYQVSEDIRSAISLDYTRYAEGFGPGIRDRSKLDLAAQVLF